MQAVFHDMLITLGCQEKKILVAVSGGLDSVVLLDLFARSNYQLAIAHANFQLRGNASDEDEEFVRQLAIKHKIGFYSHRFATNNYANELGISIQMAARELRYKWFDELLDLHRFDLIATAHHANDNLETVLLNLTRGTGIKGLTGIPSINNRVVRPFLAISRDDIEAYAAFHGITWREDASNATDDYDRNFIRHHVVPKLKELNPSIERTFSRSVERFGATEELAAYEMNRIQDWCKRTNDGVVEVPKSLLAHTQHPSAFLFEMINEYGFNHTQSEEIVEACKGQPGKQFLSLTHKIGVDRESIYISPVVAPLNDVTIQAGDNEVTRGIQKIAIDRRKKSAIDPDQQVAYVNAAQLRFPIVWRAWRQGDVFVPLGMESRKKISDFLIDKKVPMSEKHTVSVLESGGEIVWVVGYRISDKFKITDRTTDVVKFVVRSCALV